MKTKYTKVSVSDRLPSAQGMYMVIFKNNKVGKFNFWDEEAFKESWTEHVSYWLEESPDREEEMIQMLEDCKKSLDWVYENCKMPMFTDDEGAEDVIEHILHRRQELEKLLQSLTQEK